jgi:hypothetical protein
VLYTYTCQLLYISLYCYGNAIYEAKDIRISHVNVSGSKLGQVTPRCVDSQSNYASKKDGVNDFTRFGHMTFKTEVR